MLISNLGQFTAGLDAAVKKVQKEAEQSTKKLAFLVVGEIKRETPVDTGNLQNSWEVKQINSYLWIVYNDVHYGIYVNDGNSRQAPRHFVEKGIEEAVRKWKAGGK